MQSVTAAQDIVMGQSQRQELATTATILDNNAKQRLELHIFRMIKEFVSTFGDTTRMLMLKAYNPKDKVMAILTKDEIAEFGPQLTMNGQPLVDENGFLEVEVEKLQGAMYADTEVSATEGDDRAVRQETLQMLQTVLSLNPDGMPTGEKSADGTQMVMEKLNITRVIKELFREWGRTDVSEFISRVMVPVPGAPQPEPPRTNVSVSVKFETLSPAVQARILCDAKLINDQEEQAMAGAPQQEAPAQNTPTPATGEQAGSLGAPPSSEMDAMVKAADHGMAAGE
jgi:hypothetical protein